MLGLRINSSYLFHRVQAGHTEIGSNPSGLMAATIPFAEHFGPIPQVVVTAHNEAQYPDTFAVTVRYATGDHFVVNILRLDALGKGWDQNLRLDWIAWE